MIRCVKSLAVLVLVVAVASMATAAPLKIGAPAPEFKDLSATDGKSYSLDTMKDKEVVIVCITCNHCPVAVAYEDRLIEFAKKHAGADSKVGFIAVNVNNIDADKMDKMKERAKDKGFNFTYAYDPSQKIAVSLGATVTPEFFVFNKERKLVYHGAMDDNMNAEKVTKHYLVDALEATLKGETVSTPTSAPRGCGIQYEKGAR
jgi:peroxiredoxin